MCQTKLIYNLQCWSVQFSCSVVFPWTAARQASPSITDSQSLLKLESVMDPTISSSAVPFPSCLQSFPAWGSFPVRQFLASGGQGIGASASASVLLVNIQDWFPLWLTGLISWQSKGLSRVFSNTTVQKHQFFNTQPSLWSNSHLHMTTGKSIALAGAKAGYCTGPLHTTPVLP